MMKPGDILFLDTNVLLSATDTGRVFHAAANDILTNAARRGLHLAVSGQILREYAVVATRPLEVNGFGMKPEEALHNIRTFRSVTAFFEEIEATSDTLMNLVDTYHIIGQRIHDASIISTMIAHQLATLVTENIADFREFSDIETLTIDKAASELREN